MQDNNKSRQSSSAFNGLAIAKMISSGNGSERFIAYSKRSKVGLQAQADTLCELRVRRCFTAAASSRNKVSVVSHDMQASVTL